MKTIALKFRFPEYMEINLGDNAIDILDKLRKMEHIDVQWDAPNSRVKIHECWEGSCNPRYEFKVKNGKIQMVKEYIPMTDGYIKRTLWRKHLLVV
jgi:hypothetical protein